MDPVTAFSLTTGVLQVIELAFKASSMCKEIYTDGSLAQHRDAAEHTTFLAESTERLERSMQSTPRPMSEEAKDVIEVSKKCSAIAKELLAELRKLQSEPSGSLVQAIKKGTRAIRRKGVIKEIERKLGKYRDILNTRILSKLDAHAVQQNVKFETLDQNVKDLATQLSQGHKVFAQSLNNQSVALRTQLDRRLDLQEHTQAIEQMRQQFKDSLFFPEIFARQDDIPKSHEGTCHWIFGPSQVNPSDTSNGKDPDRDVRAQPWDKFTKWLDSDEDIYWLSGKPGSGKSTLMKYITSEFRNFCQSRTTMSGWGAGSDLLTCSFFFWALGNSLQKNYVGFLRSLLYQIAEQREDLIPLMMGQDLMPDGKMSYSPEPIRILAWTKERLDYALKRFLSNKPSSISVCLFIDGLDEFVGDEDLLLETLRLLSGTPQTHVCVSSRPEQIFLQGFTQSPRLRLQDLNHQDIEKTVKDRLGAKLTEKFPHSPEVVDKLMENVISRSEGIFLWTELIIKDLQRGARNSDNLQELRERFDRMPDTIEGIYQHMLDRLERPYLQEAAKYFQLLAADADFEDAQSKGFDGGYLTLLHCACAEEKAWSKVLSHDIAYFQSSEFHDICRNLETRILTRCTGLVEISEHRVEFLEGVWMKLQENYVVGVGTSQEASSVSCFLREIRFIHKTVIEFLRSHEELFHDPDWRITAAHTVARGKLGVLSLTPVTFCKEDVRPGLLKTSGSYILDLVSRLSWTEAVWPPRLSRQVTRDIGFQVVSQAYEILGYVNESLDGSGRSLFEFFRWAGEEPSWFTRFHDCVGFAAFFGRHEYISAYVVETDRSPQDVEYLLLCAFSGLYPLYGDIGPGISGLALTIQGYCKIVTNLLEYSRHTDMYMRTVASAVTANWNSKWIMFLDCSLQFIDLLALWSSKQRMDAQTRQQLEHSIVLWKNVIACFLEHDVDVNIILYGDLQLLTLDMSDFDSSTGVRIYFNTSDTLLAWAGRTFTHADLEVGKEVEDMVRSHGGQHRRTIVSVKIGGDVHPLTQEQSNRLLRAWAWEDGSLPGTRWTRWFSKDLGNRKELSLIPSTSPDARTERKLKILLDNIDQFKVTKEVFDNGGYFQRTTLDFGDD